MKNMNNNSILCIDIGNTNINFGIYKNLKIVKSFSISTNLKQTTDEYFSIIISICKSLEIDIKLPKIAIISSVVPDLNRVFEKILKDYFKINYKFLKKDDFKIEINLKYPDEIGIDRLVGVNYCISKKMKNVILIDLGTATTFDIIFNSKYEGGLIFPGINLSLDSLRSGTAKLPRVHLEMPKSIVGKTTSDAINSAIFYGYSSLIDGIVKKICKELKSDFEVIITGGLAGQISKYLDVKFKIEENLILKGIAVVEGV